MVLDQAGRIGPQRVRHGYVPLRAVMSLAAFADVRPDNPCVGGLTPLDRSRLRQSLADAESKEARAPKDGGGARQRYGDLLSVELTDDGGSSAPAQ